MVNRRLLWWVATVVALTAFVAVDLRLSGGNATTALAGAALGAVTGSLGFHAARAVHGTRPQDGLREAAMLGAPPGAFLDALILAEGVTITNLLFALVVGLAGGAFAHWLQRLAGPRPGSPRE